MVRALCKTNVAGMSESRPPQPDIANSMDTPQP
jgi:hypothetical protein